MCVSNNNRMCCVACLDGGSMYLCRCGMDASMSCVARMDGNDDMDCGIYNFRITDSLQRQRTLSDSPPTTETS